MQDLEKIMFIEDNITNNYINLHILKTNNLGKQILVHDSIFTAISYLSRNKNNANQLPKTIYYNSKLNIFNLTDFLKYVDEIKQKLKLKLNVVLITEKEEVKKKK